MLDNKLPKQTKRCPDCRGVYRCKPCNREHSRKYREQHPEYRYDAAKQSASHKATRAKYLSAWKQYLIEKFGAEPQCQVCDTPILWFSGDIRSSVNFDHRTGGIEVIKTKREGHASVNNWLRTRPCNDKNIAIFESCEFGILCQRCNQFLPTYDRLAWLARAMEYAKGE